ncbi:hypothetical protein C5167_023558 [Papaver somniferum]|uniref:3'-5' exonuclease domain-containing protein n=1 Tax=Papaver somniferum TaxID=3469 RepID=A0A4Y7JP62_PAPSO|nr:Werner Syndrome-like exonuclease [Papaver somniferum]XP_026384016.1 Werner Syndrome-like exonuclease [Papaver somniferum]RZC61810.1 hypothetical protein C5167_023570 [Papaver somniferum]RZC61812.1 hypothetical protein C5167_023558 [Papaver somniferum]
MAGSQEEVQNGLAKLSLVPNKNSSTKISTKLVDKSTTHQTYNVVLVHEKEGKIKEDKVRTTVTHTASVVDQWIASVYAEFRNKLNNLVLGLDIEWSRKSRDGYSRNKVAVVQLCFSTRCLIFHISRCDEIPESLADFLSNEKFIFVGAGIDGDAHKLWVDYGLYVGRTEEVGTLAAFKLTKTFGDYRNSGLYNAGLKNLAKDVLRLEIPKPRQIQTSNWNVSFLTEQQIEYACLDALVSFKLFIDLRSLPTPTHTNREPKKFFRDFSEKKTEEEGTEQVSDKKANGTKEAKQVPDKKPNGTKSRRP